LIDGGTRQPRPTAGKVSFRLQRELPPGTYNIQIVYSGSRTLLPSQASTTLTINPAAPVGLPIATTLTVEPVKPVEAGKPVTILAQLGLVNSDRAGALDNEAIELVINGALERRVRTDPAGKVSFRLQLELSPGTHAVQIVYRGSRTLLPSQAPATLTILPPVIDQEGQPAATTLTIEPFEPVEIGRPVTIDAQLGLVNSNRTGALDNEVVDLFIDGVHERRTRSDPAGKVSFRLQRDLPPGSYDIQIEYPGSRALAASQATARLKIVPDRVEIQTVPPLPGMKFVLGEQVFASDDQGVARITVDRPGVYPLTVQGIDASDTNIQLKFARWIDDAFTSSRQITVPLSRPLVVGFNVYHRVGQTFVDLADDPINSDRITMLTLRSSQGTVLNLDDGAPRWLLASSIARRTNGLEATQIQYSVDSVMIDGSNVVNQAQQRFYTQPEDTWKIQVLLYSMRVSGRDALFGFPIGSGLRLEYPDGRVAVKPFMSQASVSVDSLVRGIYRVSVTGAPGIAPISPVALSRDQDVRLLVISYLDLAIGLVLAAMLGIGLVLVGRPRLLPELYHQLGTVRSMSLVRVRPSILRPPDRPMLIPVSESASGGESPTLTRRKLDSILLLAFAFISIGGLAGGLGALRASAIQTSSVPTPDRPASNILSPARPTLDVSTPVAQAQPPQATTPSVTPTPLVVTHPTQVLTKPPTPDAATPVAQAQPRQAATPSDAPSPAASTQPAQVLTKPPTPAPAAQLDNPSSAEQQSHFSALKIQRVLREGSTGPDVASLQQRLRELGYFTFVPAEVVELLNRDDLACTRLKRDKEVILP
jgi:hypothetical protein